MRNLIKLIQGKEGVTSIEYGILAAGLAVAIAAIVTDDGAFVSAINDLFEAVTDAVPGGNTGNTTPPQTP